MYAAPSAHARTSTRTARRALGAVDPPTARQHEVAGATLILLISLAVGFVIAALTGWVVAIILTPLLALGLPYLLVLPKARDVELLEALDRWVRALAATLATGKSVTDAIRISRRTAPPLIADEIGTPRRPAEQPLGEPATR